jgi:hypothetical protein
VDAYACGETSYRYLAGGLSDLEFAEPEMNIRQTEFYADALKEGKIAGAATGSGGYRPSYSTIFYWVDFVCKRIEAVLQQQQKELVRRQKSLNAMPAENAVENPNNWKAQTKDKAEDLDQLTFGTLAAEILLGSNQRVWERLRAYFLTKAESCRDLLTDTCVKLSSTQTFELKLC